MSKINCVVLCIVAMCLAKAYSISDEDKAALRAVIEPIVAECSKEHGVSSDELKAAKEAQNADNLNQCFLGCLMKKGGILNEKGEYDVEAGLGKLKEHLKDPSQFEGIAKKCAKVNDVPVTDGTSGCERAKLLMACVLENKAEIPL